MMHEHRWNMETKFQAHLLTMSSQVVNLNLSTYCLFQCKVPIKSSLKALSIQTHEVEDNFCNKKQEKNAMGPILT